MTLLRFRPDLLLLVPLVLQSLHISSSSAHPSFFSTQSPHSWARRPHPPWRLLLFQQQQRQHHHLPAGVHLSVKPVNALTESGKKLNNSRALQISGPDYLCDGANCGQHSSFVDEKPPVDPCSGEGDSNARHPCSPSPRFSRWIDQLTHTGRDFPVLHVARLVAWLFILFYLLGTTASDYFSCTLEKLSDTLKLSPAVAGVSLLAIGNGAPDVFSSVAAFISSDKSGGIGFSCVLGGALFITTVVSGAVSLVTARSCKAGLIRIDLACFIRDAMFLLASCGALVLVLLDGKVYLWEAIAFLCIYVLYAIIVAAGEMVRNYHKEETALLDPLLFKAETPLPQWVDHASEVHHHYHVHVEGLERDMELSLEDSEKQHSVQARLWHFFIVFYRYCIEWPLGLPRWLTIPVVEEERWSRPLAVASCTFAPVLVGIVWILQCSESAESSLVAAGITVLLGIVSGLIAFFNTENSKPPQRFLWLWLGVGFVMSIVWFYLIADELVATLEALGSFFGINPALLGLTVLAWGNSVEDLVGDLALACSGRDGVQIAISGCYAGPLFNTVVGLGLSLIVACSKSSPEPFLVVDDDGILFFIIGFLTAGLAWALLMMPLKGMILSRTFGAGLLLLYCSFLGTGVCYTMGWISR